MNERHSPQSSGELEIRYLRFNIHASDFHSVCFPLTDPVFFPFFFLHFTLYISISLSISLSFLLSLCLCFSVCLSVCLPFIHLRHYHHSIFVLLTVLRHSPFSLRSVYMSEFGQL